MKITHTRTGAEAEVTEATAERRISTGRWLAADSPAQPERSTPAQSDTKAAWVAHAVEQGADPDDAEAQTKADLIERYG